MNKGLKHQDIQDHEQRLNTLDIKYLKTKGDGPRN